MLTTSFQARPESEPQTSPSLATEALVIGSGLAGLTAALSLAEQRDVLLVSKGALPTSASWLAQGGISAVFAAPDSVESHVHDTLVAGAFLNDVAATRHMVNEGRPAVDWLIERGVPFTKEDGRYHLTREGGHSERRILHVEDMTGRAIQATLLQQVRSHPRIQVLEHHTVVRLLCQDGSCVGAWLVGHEPGAPVRSVQAEATVLATGGAGQVFLHATAPVTSTGDGIALAWEIGCRIANLEFLQFHPTCMVYPQGEPFLITEAVRGEGGFLRLPDGERFMARYDDRLELAPRDVVSRAIYAEMKRLNLPAVMLDISHKPEDFVRSHFPNIYETCRERGLDITREPIPVAPASHYTCGGVLSDVHGRTDVEGMHAIGETACSGLHGANRLASNSLLECVVMARAASQDILSTARRARLPAKPGPQQARPLSERERGTLALARQELRKLMWDYVGIVRHFDGLRAAQRRVELLTGELARLTAGRQPERASLELRSLLTTATLIIRSALSRQESLGCHFNEDCSAPNDAPTPTVLACEGMPA